MEESSQAQMASTFSFSNGAVNLSDLHTEEGLKSLNQFLSGKTYISEDNFPEIDIKAFDAVLGKPGDAFPNADKWYDAMSSHFPVSASVKAQGGKAPVLETSLDFLEMDNPSTWQFDHTSNQIKYTGAMARVTKADGRVIRCEVSKRTITLPMPPRQVMAHLINNQE